MVLSELAFIPIKNSLEFPYSHADGRSIPGCFEIAGLV
jgi:hypothetical protein